MQSTTKVTQHAARSSSGAEVSVLVFSGDISSASKEALMEAYRSLGPGVSHILLDVAGVDYINSSGISIIIQMLLEAKKTGSQVIGIFGLAE